MRRNNKKGLSLNELMVSLTIISVVYTLGSISVQQYRTSISSDLSIDSIANIMKEARNKAINELNNVIVIFNKDTNTRKYLGSYSVCDDDNSNSICDPEESIITYNIRPEVIFAVVNSTNGSSNTFKGLDSHNPSPTDPILDGVVNPKSKESQIVFRKDGSTDLSYYKSVIYLVPREDINKPVPRLDRFRALDIVSTTGNISVWRYNGKTWVKS